MLKYCLQICLVTFIGLSSTGYSDTASIQQGETDVEVFVSQQLATERWDLVMFWATDCPPCKKDFQKLADLIHAHPDLSFTLIGIVIDGEQHPQLAENIIQQNNLDYAHVLTNYQAANEFHQQVTDQDLLGTPSYILYDQSNVMVAQNPSVIDIDALLMFIED